MADPRLQTDPELLLVVNGAWSGEPACVRCRRVHVEPDVKALANAIARVDIWDGSQAVVVARSHPPAVAALGRLTPETRSHLDTLGWQIRDLLPRVRRLGYEEMEGLVARLRDRLISNFGEEFLRTASFTAIPRGGLIVLGMLSYALELVPPQFDSRRDRDRPVVVVDDIAVTGHRLREFLASMPDGEVVFAHLLSHPDLRHSVEAWKERRVRCVAASDLVDHAPAHFGQRYASWKTTNEMAGRFWVGMPDHVITPWGEPDIGLWDDSREEMGLGLRLADDGSLGYRWGRSDPFVPVQLQEPGSGEIGPSPDTIFGEVGSEIILGRADGGPVVGLKGRAADLWRSILNADQIDEALSRVPQADRGQLTDLVDRLTELGLLTA